MNYTKLKTGLMLFTMANFLACGGHKMGMNRPYNDCPLKCTVIKTEVTRTGPNINKGPKGATTNPDGSTTKIYTTKADCGDPKCRTSKNHKN